MEPLTKEKLQTLEQLVQEQLNVQHTEEAISTWQVAELYSESSEVNPPDAHLMEITLFFNAIRNAAF